MQISIISLILISITISCVSAKAKVTVNSNTVTFNDCLGPDLRNIKDFHKSPHTVHFSHCYLPELPNSVFLNLSKLKSLEICESKLSHIQVCCDFISIHSYRTNVKKRRKYIIKMLQSIRQTGRQN